MTHIEEFSTLLRRHAATYSDLKEKFHKRPGLRIYRFSGDFLRAMLDEDNCAAWIADVLSRLPLDAVILDHSGYLIRMSVYYSTGSFMDEYIMIFASCEWDGPEEAGMIPELPLSFYQTRKVPPKETSLQELRDTIGGL